MKILTGRFGNTEPKSVEVKESDFATFLQMSSMKPAIKLAKVLLHVHLTLQKHRASEKTPAKERSKKSDAPTRKSSEPKKKPAAKPKEPAVGNDFVSFCFLDD